MAKNIIKKSRVFPTILISGGATFLGSNLAKALTEEEAFVVCVDSTSDNSIPLIKTLNKRDNFAFITHDINKSLPEEIESVDFIFHLANFETYTLEKNEVMINSLLANSNGTRNLLALAKKSGSKFLLGSSIDIYQGLISSISLEHYFGISEREEEKFSSIETKRFSEALVWEHHKKQGLDARIARLSNIYGPGMNLESPNSLAGMLKAVLQNKPVSLAGDGLQKEYYLYISDAVDGLIKAMFSKNTNGNIHPLSPAEPITSLELAYLLRSVSKTDFEITFSHDKDEMFFATERNIEKEAQRQINFSPKVGLREGLRNTLDYFGYKEPATPQTPTKSVTTIIDKGSTQKDPLFQRAFPNLTKYYTREPAYKPSRYKDRNESREHPNKEKQTAFFSKIAHYLKNVPKTLKSKYIYLSVISTLIVFVFTTTVLPCILFIIFSFNGYKNLQKAQTFAKDLNFSEIHALASSAKINFRNAKRNINNVYIGRSFVSELTEVHRLLNIGIYVSESLESLGLNKDILSNIYLNLSPSSDFTLSKDEIINFSSNVKIAKKLADLAYAEMETLDPKRLPKFVLIDISNTKEKLKLLKEFGEDLQIVSNNLLDLLGYLEPKKYLVLLENPSELRAGGGFIGSYAQIHIRNGKIQDLKIDDIYNPDGILDKKGIYFPPPDPIKKFLRVDSLRIRDANWYADFRQNAIIIEDLFEAATEVKIDGVFAVNLFAVEDLLDIVGDIYLSSYDETVTSSNLYEKSQFHSEAFYFKGSQQKKTFLTSLGTKLTQRLFELGNDKLPLLLATLYKSLEEKNLLLYVNTGTVREVLYRNNWDGSLVALEGDYLYIVDSNLGATKANFTVEKNVNYEIKNTKRDGSFEAILTINYIHRGKERSWPGGPLLNYLRVLVPKNAYLHKVIRSGEGLDEKGEDITNLVKVVPEGNKRSFESSFVLNPGKSLSLSFNYTLPLETVSVGNGRYSLFIQKQPGTRFDPYTFTFSTPFGKKLTKIPEGSEELLDGIKTFVNLDTNKYILVEYE